MIAAARKHWPFTVGLVTTLLGVVILLLGWQGAANTTVLQYQLPYIISGGILGGALIVLGGIYQVGYALWWQLQRNASGVSAPAVVDGALPPLLAAVPDDLPAEPPTVLAVTGGSSYHVEGCRAATGKAVRRLTPAAARREGLQPCRICSG